MTKECKVHECKCPFHKESGSENHTAPPPAPAPAPSVTSGGTNGLSAEAARLLQRLDQIQRDRQYMLSGIYDRNELDFVNSSSGKYPVVRGVDFMNYSPAYVRHAGPPGDDVAGYIADTRRHGFVNTASWHWVPSLPGVDGSNYGSAFYKMDFANIQDYVHTTLRDDVDAIAAPLRQFRDAGLPVIWRPLHEFTQHPWFWWSANADLFKSIWNMMYERLTHHHGLNNLIWCWNAAHNYNLGDRSFYPGDDRVHIVSIDYPEDVRSAYNGLKNIADKPVAVAEISWNDWQKYTDAFFDAPYCYVCSWSREQGAIAAGSDAVRRVMDNERVRALPWE